MVQSPSKQVNDDEPKNVRKAQCLWYRKSYPLTRAEGDVMALCQVFRDMLQVLNPKIGSSDFVSHTSVSH